MYSECAFLFRSVLLRIGNPLCICSEPLDALKSILSLIGQQKKQTTELHIACFIAIYDNHVQTKNMKSKTSNTQNDS